MRVVERNTLGAMEFTEHLVPRDQYRIDARDYPGEAPAIVLMHGFPDNLHLYDRLVLQLAPSRRVITFDFLGWGSFVRQTC
jgi:pimeloyl-ACP methyl ester carboxylesterase